MNATIVSTWKGIGDTVVEVTEELYWEALEVLPPIYCQGFFMVSEPIRHTPEGTVYACFRKSQGKYYAIEATQNQAAICFSSLVSQS